MSDILEKLEAMRADALERLHYCGEPCLPLPSNKVTVDLVEKGLFITVKDLIEWLRETTAA